MRDKVKSVLAIGVALLILILAVAYTTHDKGEIKRVFFGLNDEWMVQVTFEGRQTDDERAFRMTYWSRYIGKTHYVDVPLEIAIYARGDIPSQNGPFIWDSAQKKEFKSGLSNGSSFSFAELQFFDKTQEIVIPVEVTIGDKTETFNLIEG